MKQHLIKAAITIFAIIGCFMLFLNARLDIYLAEHSWREPISVYSRSAELTLGQKFSAPQLEDWLTVAGYEYNPYLTGAAQFKGDQEWMYWTAAQHDQQQFAVNFENGRVKQLLDVSSNLSLNHVILPKVYLSSLFAGTNSQRRLVALDEVPTELIDAVIVSEDRQFFSHSGVSIFGILRALWSNIRAGKVVQGGSTITQQLVKNTFFDHSPSYWRKLQEAFMAYLLEQKLTKDEILEAYLNAIYLGQTPHGAVIGVEAAAQFYFNKSVSQLDANESVSIAALVRGANYYHPKRHPDRLLSRRNLLLEQMQEFQRIGQRRAEQISQTELPHFEFATFSRKQPAYLSLTHRELRQRLHAQALKNAEGEIVLTIDPLLQQTAQKSLIEGLLQLGDPKLKASMIVVQKKTGAVLAMANGSYQDKDSYNYAAHARRQIGSLVKPFSYYIAFKKGHNWNTTIEDEAFELTMDNGQTWQPQNFDKKTYGSIASIEAFKRSLNLSSAKLCLDKTLLDLSKQLNKILQQQRIQPYPSLCLGAIDLSLMDVAQLYQGLVNDGSYRPLYFVEKVALSDTPELAAMGNLPHLDWAATYQIHQGMRAVTSEGTAQKLRWELPGMQIIGKTGTSDEQRDAWFAGATEDLLVVVWTGHADNSPTRFTGSSAALNLWIEFIQRIQE